jgi:serine protease
MRYQGGRVLLDPRVHVVFWGSEWGQPDANGMPTADPLGVAPMVVDFFGRLGGKGDTWSTILTQYCLGTKINDKTCGPGSRKIPRMTKSPLRGWWVDASPGAGQPGVDVRTGAWHEPANRGLKHFGATHPDDIVVLMVPPGADSVTDCSPFHTVADTDAGKRPLIVMPYPVPGPACPGRSPVCEVGKPDTCLPGNTEYTITGGASHEYAEVVTNPFPTNCLRTTGVCGWIVKDAPAYASRPEPLHTEISDTCSNHAFVQLNGKKTVVATLWSNTANKGKGACVSRYVSEKDQG